MDDTYQVRIKPCGCQPGAWYATQERVRVQVIKSDSDLGEHVLAVAFWATDKRYLPSCCVVVAPREEKGQVGLLL